MPDPQPKYQPNDPRFYTFRNKFGNMGNLIGGKVDANIPDEEFAQAKASQENYRAYVISLLPWKASEEEVINHVIEMAPELRVDEAQWANRRQKSENARQAILKTALRWARNMVGRPTIDRLDSCFYNRGIPEEIKEQNDQVQERLRISPEERGRMLQERVDKVYNLYQRVLNHDVDDEELIENLEEFHILQDLVMNAQNFLAGTKPDEKTGKIYISFPDTLREIMRDMERNSAEIFRFVDRVRTIANPNYEFLDLDRMIDFDGDKFDEISEYASDSGDPVIVDTAEVVLTNRHTKRIAGKNNVLRQLEYDFPEEHESAIIQFVGTDKDIYELTRNKNTHYIETQFDRGGILVTAPSGKAACYYLDNATGRIRESDSSEVYTQVATAAVDVRKMLKKANAGLFIGSKEYQKALDDMSKILKDIKKIGNPPSIEKMAQATDVLRAAMENAQAYMTRKAAGRHYITRIKESTPRENARYKAMERFADYCKMQINVYALKRQEMEAEMQAAQQNIGEQDLDVKHDVAEGVNEGVALAASDKVKNVYGNEAALSASDVGTIADELRADINGSLTRMLNGDFTKEEASETLSNMVLLEIIKSGRIKGANGKVFAGDLEIALADKPNPVVQGMRENAFVKAVTENLTLTELCQFIMDDKAKALADKITGIAKDYNPENQGNEMQQQKNDVQIDPNVPNNTI